MNKIKKLAGQTAIYGVSSIVGRILGYLLVPLYVRVLAPTEFSIYVELYAYFTFLNILYTYGMETTFFRFVNDHKKPKKVYSTSLLSLVFTAIIFSGLLYFNREAIISTLNLPGASSYILACVSMILAFDTIAVIPFASLRQQERPIKFATIKVINIFINIGSNLFFLVLCPYLSVHCESESITSFLNIVYSPDIGVGYIFISNLIASGLTVLLLSKELLSFNFDIDLTLLRKMIKYALPLLLVGLAGMTIEAFDRTILRHLLPFTAEENKAMLGIYGANVKLAVIMLLIVQAFKFAAEPFFFSQAKYKDAKDTYAEVMKYFVAFGLLVFLTVTLYLDIFKYFVGKKGSPYHEGLGVIPILLMANLFLGIYYNLSIWYKLLDKTKYGAYMSIIGAIMTIIINVAFIPVSGYFASAWAKFAAYGAMVLISYFIGRRFYPINYPLGRVLFYFAIAIILYFTSLLLIQYAIGEMPGLKIAINTFLIVFYISIFVYVEKIPILRLLKR